MLCMLYLLYYIVIFKVVACVCIYPDMLCMHFCIILQWYVCVYVCICELVYIYVQLHINVLCIYPKGFI